MMRVILFCLFASLSLTSPVPEDSLDVLDVTEPRKRDLEVQGTDLRPTTYSSETPSPFPDVAELDIPSNADDATNSGGSILCSRDLDINSQIEPSSEYEITKSLSRSCPVSTVTTPLKLDIHQTNDPYLQCPETKRGEPSYHKLCCLDWQKRPPLEEPNQGSTYTPRRSTLTIAGISRSKCVDYDWRTCLIEFAACCRSFNAGSGGAGQCIPGNGRKKWLTKRNLAPS